MVRLGIWYVRHLLATRRIAPSQARDALSRRVNIYRLTSLWDGVHDPAYGYRDSEWERLLDLLVPIVQGALPTESATCEEAALGAVRPLLRPVPEAVPGRRFGCWSYEPVGEHVADRRGLLGRVTNSRKIFDRLQRLAGISVPERHASLHFTNAAGPDSPFDNVPRLAADLSALIQDCRARHPTVKFLWCQSWLNSHPAFLALLPEPWRRSASVRSTDDMDSRSLGRGCLNTLNWWGQFMRSDGTFHEQRGQRFRRSGGQFPYANQVCHDRLDNILQFLDDIRRVSVGTRS